MNFLRKIKKYFIENKIYLNKDEISFLNFLKKNRISKNKNSRKTILINAYSEYYSLTFIFLLIREKRYINHNFILYFPVINFYKFSYKNNILKFVYFFYNSLIRDFLINFGWRRFYNLIVNNNYTHTNKNIFQEIKLLKVAEQFIHNIKTKKNLQEFRYKGILIGDLIYDTYLRFANKVTVDLKDPFLLEIFAKSIFATHQLQKNFGKSQIECFLTKQSAYIQHGIITRFFLKQKVPTYNFDNKIDYLREITSDNFYIRKNYEKYRSNFSKLKNKKFKIKISQQLLSEKFSGKIINQEKWMPISVYHNTKIKVNKKIRCVLFLHCFIDSPLAWGKIIFNDFHDWTIKTLDFLQESGLEEETIIKGHPNAKEGSKEFETYLKKKYPKFVWLDKNSSNKEIFKLKPHFGLSVYGTVLHEMAYHKIYPIAAGDNPCMSFSFVKTCKNQKEYFHEIKRCIRNKPIYKPNKKEIYEMVYCNYIHDETEHDLIAKRVQLKELMADDGKDTTALRVFIRKFNKLFL